MKTKKLRLYLETQPPPTTRTRGGTQQARRSNAWNEEEDEALTQAWIFVYQDSIKGNHHSTQSFSSEVVGHFHALLGVELYRTYDACNSKFRELKKAITDFSGCFNKAKNRNESDGNQIDVLLTIQTIYKTRNADKDFCHLKVWRVARDKPRWFPQSTSEILSDSTDSNKRARTFEPDVGFNLDLNDNENDNEVEFEVDTSRPIGRDAAKRVVSGKIVASEDPLVGNWNEHLQLAKERAQRKERLREKQERMIEQ